MRKILSLLVVFSMLIVSAYAAETTFMSNFSQKLHNIGQKTDKTDDIDAKIEKQQQDYEKELAAREEKIQKQQQERLETYNATQKRLDSNREQLRKLLEE